MYALLTKLGLPNPRLHVQSHFIVTMKRSLYLIAGVFIVSCFMLLVGNQQLRAERMTPANLSGFVENRGQWTGDFSYRAKSGNVSTWITPTGMVFDVRGASIKTGRRVESPSKFRSMTESMVDEELVQHHAVFVSFDGAHAASMQPSGTIEGSYNFLQGADRSTWVQNVPHYSSVTMKGLYNGVDAFVTMVNNAPQYNFIVAPGADASQIAMKIEGATSLSTSNGELVIGTSCGQLRNGSIYAYQLVDGKEQKVACSFRVENNTVRFDVGSYDKGHTLVIDPIVYATYVGGDDLDVVTSSARIASSGDMIVIGYSTSSNFPKTSGSYTSPAIGAEDAFVIKYDPKLSKMLFCTIVGGSSTDKPWDVCIARNDQSDDILVVGETSSNNFPTKSGSYKQNQQGLVDAFAFRLMNNGTDLKWSTYFGGSNGDDRAYSVCVSGSNQVIFCGSTTSTNFPATAGVGYKTALGKMDGFCARIGSNGGTLEYATYYGGSGDDRCTAVNMAATKENIACVVGETNSGNLPLYPTKTTGGGGGGPPVTTILAPQKTMKGVTDCFFVQFNSSASGTPNFSTYFGGNGQDFPTSILVNAAGVVTLAGGTQSTDLSQILNYQSTKHAGQECLLAQINATGDAFTMTAYFGGNGADVALDFDTDDGTNLFLVGRTSSSDLPTTDDAEQKTFSTGGSDGFITKIGSYINMRYCSYIGSKSADSINTITVVDMQNAYLGGLVSNTMKTTDSAAQKTMGGAADGYFAKWTFSALAVNTPATGDKKCAGLPISATWFASNSETGDKYLIEYSADNGTTWTTIKKDHAGLSYNWTIPATLAGGTNYRIRVTNQITGQSAINPGAFTVLAAPSVSSISPDTSLCIGQAVTLNVVASGDNLSYQWRRAGQAIGGATQASYAITAATSADSASFDCIVSGTCTPSKTSTACFVRVFRGPTVLTQPTNVTIHSGKQAHFEVVAAGKNLRYQWQYNGSNASGATNATYDFFAQAQDAGSYRCIVTGDCGTDTSKVATLTIDDTGVPEDVSFDGALQLSSFSPNPTSDIARVVVNSSRASALDYIVFNELGQIVIKGSAEAPAGSSNGSYQSNFGLNTSSLPQGAYKLMIISGDTRVFKSFIVQR